MSTSDSTRKRVGNRLELGRCCSDMGMNFALAVANIKPLQAPDQGREFPKNPFLVNGLHLHAQSCRVNDLMPRAVAIINRRRHKL